MRKEITVVFYGSPKKDLVIKAVERTLSDHYGAEVKVKGAEK